MDSERKQAFEAMVAARTPALLRTAYLLTGGDSHMAQDLVQSALIRTYTRWGRLRDPHAGEAYLRRVMASEAAGWRRRRWNGEHSTAVLPETADVDAFAPADTREVLRGALRELKPAWRVVLVLRFFEDLSEQETARLLGVSVGTVKSRTSRALDELRARGLALTAEEVP